MRSTLVLLSVAAAILVTASSDGTIVIGGQRPKAQLAGDGIIVIGPQRPKAQLADGGTIVIGGQRPKAQLA